MNSPLSILAITFLTTLLLPTITISSTTSRSPTTIMGQQRGTEDLITTICKSTPDPHLCETSLRSDPRSAGANTEGLIIIMIDVVKSDFNNSLRYVNGLIKQEPKMVAQLQQCAKLYKFVLDYNVKTATQAVNLGDPKFGEEAMVDSGIEAQSCESQFDGVDRSPLSDKNKLLVGVSNVAAALIKNLE